jgi:hypothetical protein
LIALAVAGIVVTTSVVIDDRGAAQERAIDLRLVAQSFAIEPGGVLELELRLDAPPVASTTASTTTTAPTTTTTTTTTITPTTTPSDPFAPPPASADTTAPPTSAAPPTTVPVSPTASFSLVVTAHEPIRVRADVAEVLAGRVGPAVDSATYAYDAITSTDPATGEAVIAVDVATAVSGDVADQLELPRAGLYPITVNLLEGTRRVARLVTFAERLIDAERGLGSAQMDVSFLAEVADPGPEPTADELNVAARQLTELINVADAVSAPITVRLPPDATRVLDDDPALAERAQTALAGDETVALPRHQLDPSSAVAAGEVDTFTRTLRSGEDLLTDRLPDTSTGRTVWTATEPLSTAGATMLRDLGVRLLVVPYEQYLALEGSLGPDFTDPSSLYDVALDGGATISLAIIDPVAGALDAARAGDRTPAERAVEVVATLAATRIQLQRGDHHTVLSTPELSIPDADVAAIVEALTTSHPAFSVTVTSEAPGRTDTMEVYGEPVRLELPTTAGPDLTERAARITDVRLATVDTGSMLPADDGRPNTWNADLDVALSTAFDDERADERIDLVVGDIDLVRASVVPPEPFSFTLTGSTAELPIRIGNTSDTPLDVVVRPSGSKLVFPNGDQLVTLAPLASTTVVIDVEARARGKIPIAIELLTPAGTPLAGPVPGTARLNALTGLGPLITGIAALVLASWWYSHFRRRRRHQLADRALASSDGHPSRGRRRAAATVAATADELVSPDAAEAGSRVTDEPQ